MRSYFKDRLNRVKVGKATIDWNVMKRGCPQGSSFGPTLWNLPKWSMVSHKWDCKFNMYADDHQMYIFGSDMSIFSQHISELCKKASQMVGVLARLRNLITTETKLLRNKTAIMPYLTYCHLTCHFCKASDTRTVERIQERALRIVYNSHSETYMNLLDCAKIPSLLNRRLQDIVIPMYKVK